MPFRMTFLLASSIQEYRVGEQKTASVKREAQLKSLLNAAQFSSVNASSEAQSQSSGVEASDWLEYWPLIGQDEMDHVTPYVIRCLNQLLSKITDFALIQGKWRLSRNDTFFALMVTSF